MSKIHIFVIQSATLLLPASYWLLKWSTCSPLQAVSDIHDPFKGMHMCTLVECLYMHMLVRNGYHDSHVLPPKFYFYYIFKISQAEVSYWDQKSSFWVFTAWSSLRMLTGNFTGVLQQTPFGVYRQTQISIFVHLKDVFFKWTKDDIYVSLYTPKGVC